MLVGEIGIPRHDFLYEMKSWEIHAIVKGYRRRTREHWDMTRLLGLTIANSMGAKLTSFNQYFPLPWDQNGTHEITEEEARELIAQMQRENAALQTAYSPNQT